MCDKFDFQAQMQIQIYLGQIFFSKYKYKYIWDDIFLGNTNTNIFGFQYFRWLQKPIYLCLPKMGKYE